VDSEDESDSDDEDDADSSDDGDNVDNNEGETENVEGPVTQLEQDLEEEREAVSVTPSDLPAEQEEAASAGDAESTTDVEKKPAHTADHKLALIVDSHSCHSCANPVAETWYVRTMNAGLTFFLSSHFMMTSKVVLPYLPPERSLCL
jgi:hypothetical protein